MPNRYLKWCLAGCGKSVYCINLHKSLYVCSRCGRKFTGKELREGSMI